MGIKTKCCFFKCCIVTYKCRFLLDVKKKCFHLIEVNHGSWMCESQTYSRLFLVLFPDYKNISMYLPESLHDLNKSWLLSFVSRAVRATGLWRPLNYSSQTDDWLLIHSFFWKECLIIIPISTPSREKLPSQAVKILHSGFTGSSKLKGSASDTLTMAHQKLRRKKKDELCKISLNIAFAEDGVPHARRFQSQTREQLECAPAGSVQQR